MDSINDVRPQSHEDTKKHKDFFQPLTIKEQEVGKQIVFAAFEIHKALGPACLRKFRMLV